MENEEIIKSDETTALAEIQEQSEIQEILNPIICQNCGTACHDKFCPKCGQDTTTKRLTIASMLRNLLTAILSNDGGVVFSLRNLFYRPSGMILDFISGKRKTYFSPFPMLFLALGLYILIFSNTGSLDANFNENTIIRVETGESETELETKEITDFYFKAYQFYTSHYTLITIVLIPMYLCLIRFFFGKKFRKTYNWAETCVLYVYTLVQLMLLNCISSLLFLVSEAAKSNMDNFIRLMYIVLLAWNIHKLTDFGIVKILWRSLLVNFTALIMIIFIIGALIIFPLVKTGVMLE